MPVRIVGLAGLPEVKAGDDLAALIRAAAPEVDSRTIVVVAQKIVSKAEGAVVDLRKIVPSPRAIDWAARYGKDARLIELALRESRRIVRMERGVLIGETRHGFITAHAGVDFSNVPGDHFATTLPLDPDASAAGIRAGLRCGAVIVSDTFGRPWREGLVNVAIGVAGLEPLADLRRTRDWTGKPLQSTLLATADELAAAAGLVMPKAAGIPVAMITGFDWTGPGDSARRLIRPPETDLFR
ncbi:MAG TPA: coenzyme F420-0:L-glutamate ligase [Bryobacteraceae bacterium]|nr:coenzyme F420-0:L-glutamate ligase [Bryobacteraceae bacterium]